MPNYRDGVTCTITPDTSKPHNLVTGYNVTAVMGSTFQTNIDTYYRLTLRTGDGIDDVEDVYHGFYQGYFYTGAEVRFTAETSICSTRGGFGYTCFRSGTQYYAQVTFSSASATPIYSTNKATPVISASFKGGYMRPDVANSIQFTPDHLDTIYTQYTIKSGVFYYKLSSASNYSTISFTGSNLNIPANTFTTGNTYNIYAIITVDDNQTARVNMGNVSTVDAKPSVTALSPINAVTYGNVTFKWNYSISTGTKQRAFTIHWSTNGVDDWHGLAVQVESPAQSYTAYVPNSGTTYWRVRVFNQDLLASDFSAVNSFVNNIPPAAPTLTRLNTVGRPSVSWESSAQVAYQVQFLTKAGDIFEDSGTVYTGNKTYQATNYFPMGGYSVRVRIYNALGVASNWLTRQFTIIAYLTPPPFTVTLGNPGLIINISATDVYAKYYILRNGVPIGVTTGDTYYDYFANGKTTYTVIGVTSYDNSAQSTQTVNISTNTNMLVDLDGTIYRVNRRLASPVGVAYNVTAVFDTAEFIGAERPEFHFAKMREARFTVTFKDYVNIEEMLGKTMYYADMYGNGAYVCITSIGRTESRFGNETSAELQVTHYDDRINYDA